jgi:tRNA 2-thiouridine synthesizing protein A
MADEILIDARGLLCPLPVLRLAKAFRAAPEGAVLRLLATDPASVQDVEAYCQEAGKRLLGWGKKEGVFEFRVVNRKS